MSKKVLGDFELPAQGDIIDQIAGQEVVSDVDQLKTKTDLIDLLAWFGLSGSQKGNEWLYKCPFHDDTNPSLSANRTKGLWQCFGCGKKGDALIFIQEIKQTDFKGALEILREYHQATPGKKPTPAKDAKKAPVVEQKVESHPVITLVDAEPVDLSSVNDCLRELVKHYSASLFSSDAAREYLEKRGLYDPRLINDYQIGFVDGSLLKRLNKQQRLTLSSLDYLRDNGKEHFLNCIVVPLFDENKQVVGMYGRRISDRKPLHLYLKGEHKTVFNLKAFKVFDEIILTESILDCLSLIKMGFGNCCPLYGINGLTPVHKELLTAERIKTIVLAFDNDDAGKKAAKTYKESLLETGLMIKVVFPPQGKDWNDCLVAGIKSDQVKELIDSAEVFQDEEAALKNTIKFEKDGLYWIFVIEDITYQLLGVKEFFVNNLRVNINAGRNKKRFRDNCELYSDRSRKQFSFNTSQELEVETGRISRDLSAMLDCLEADRDKRIVTQDKKEHVLTEDEIELGMNYLNSPDMFDQLIDDLSALGYVGEDINKLLLYIAGSSRKLAHPISILIISQSGAGKSFLVEKIMQLLPEEDVFSVTSLSDQSLNYLEKDMLLHKFLVLGEMVHSDQIMYQIREIISSQVLSRLVTMKDESTGKMVSQTVKSDIIVSVVMSTTSHRINGENASRAFIINIDESEEQSKRIQAQNNDKYSLKRIYKKDQEVPLLIKKHQAAQRLLKKRQIVNPYGRFIEFPSQVMRSRRDHERFIDLIACVCFLRQYQKPAKIDDSTGLRVEFIECDMVDYRIAYRILCGTLEATMSDFPMSASLLYDGIRAMVRGKASRDKLGVEQVGFTQRELRDETGYNQMFIKRNLRILVDYEYIKKMGSNQRGGKHRYQLLQDVSLAGFDISMIPKPEELEGIIRDNS